MPKAPGESDEAYAKRQAAEKAKDKRKKEEAEKRAKYGRKLDPSTVEELVDADELGQTVFKDGEWRPSWAIVEFVSWFWIWLWVWVTSSTERVTRARLCRIICLEGD